MPTVAHDTETTDLIETTSGGMAASKHDTWVMFTFLFSAICLIGATVALGLGWQAVDDARRTVAAGAGTGPVQPAMTMVHLTEFAITPKTIEVPQGSTLKVMNGGTMVHNLEIKGSTLKTEDVASGGTANLKLGSLAPGTYTMFCAIPGHEGAGMKGTLTVAAGTGGSGDTASATTPTTAMSTADFNTMMAKTVKEFPAKTAGLGAQVLAPTILPDGTKHFELTAEVVQWEKAAGDFVEAWTYNGVVPGPTMHVNPGDKVEVVLHNSLPEPTVIHFHGIQLPNAMDGVPDITQPAVDPGQTFTYHWTAQPTPAVGMYHSHDNAVKQVANGLAGAFLIGEQPVPAGVNVSQELIMMLNDAGTIGLTLNGKSFPATAPIVTKLGDWVEVHYMNEGQSIHPMHLHGIPQLVIAKDGFALDRPEMQDTVTVAPGERYTVLVHATVPGVWAWHCHILSHAENETGMFGMVTALIVA